MQTWPGYYQPATKATKHTVIYVCLQVEAMKIGAKEMKKAYKDVKLDQIDVCLFSVLYW